MERIGVRKSSFNIERGYEDVGVGGGGAESLIFSLKTS